MGYLMIGFAIIAFLDLSPLIQRREKKPLIIYGILYVSIFTLCLLATAGVKIPSIMMMLEDFFRYTLRLTY